jgi:hypothetical protein
MDSRDSYSFTHIVNVGFSWAGDQEESGSQPPHGGILEKSTRLIIKKPVLFAALFFLAFYFLPFFL